MPEKVIPARPMSKSEELLRTKFYESVAAQSDLMDKLAERLLTLELAIPGLFAAALKALRGEKATAPLTPLLTAAFVFWFAALMLTLIALTPKTWRVNVGVLKQDSKKLKEELGVEDFFQQSALYKRKFIFAASVCFFFGVACAALSV